MISHKLRPISPIANDVLEGLKSTPKRLPPKLFYDQIGSGLFEQITQLPEYYLTRTEQGILDHYADEIIAAAGANLTLIELGAGTASKTRSLIRAALRVQDAMRFYPVDVSPAALATATSNLSQEFSALFVHPVVADYTEGLPQLRNIKSRKLVLYIGSSVGNFEPMAASALLRQVCRSLAPGDSLLLGTDLAKDPNLLIPAYDDAEGVTAAFNKNMLARINRELGGHFDLTAFRHVVEWNGNESRIEIYLQSEQQQVVTIDDINLLVSFRKGERIHTENSYKFTPDMVNSVLRNGGFALEHTWTDSHRLFALHLARVA